MNRKTHKIICTIIVIILLIAVFINIGVTLFGYLKAFDLYKMSSTQENYNAIKIIQFSAAFNSLLLFIMLILFVGLTDTAFFIKNKISNKKYILAYIIYTLGSSLIALLIKLLAKINYDVLFYICTVFMTVMMIAAIELRRKIGLKYLK